MRTGKHAATYVQVSVIAHSTLPPKRMLLRVSRSHAISPVLSWMGP